MTYSPERTEKMTIVAWHGEPGLKSAALERLREHRRLEEITQRVYWQGGRGCHQGDEWTGSHSRVRNNN